MATKKRVKFIKPWRLIAAGAEMELDTPVADLLIANGRAVEVKPPEPAKTLKKKRRSRLKNANR